MLVQLTIATSLGLSTPDGVGTPSTEAQGSDAPVLSAAEEAARDSAQFEARGEYKEAARSRRRACNLMAYGEGAQREAKSDCLRILGALYRESAQYEEAERVLERLVSDLRAQPEVSPALTARALNELALNYGFMGDYTQAEPLFEEAIRLDRDPTYLNNLGVLIKKQGRYDEALEKYRQALEIREKTLPSDHPDVAESLNNVANLYLEIGEYERSLKLFEQALSVRRGGLGDFHPATGQSYVNLAVVHTAIGNLAKALKLALRGLEIRRETLGELHPDTAHSLDTLAVVYFDSGRREEAVEAAERALHIREKVLGPEHPAVAVAYSRLGSFHQDPAQAARYHRRASQIAYHSLGENHGYSAMISIDLASACLRISDEALCDHPPLELLVERLTAAYGSYHPHILVAKGIDAQLKIRSGEYEAARELLEESLSFASHHPRLPGKIGVPVHRNLAFVYLAQGNRAAAIAALRSAMAVADEAVAKMTLMGDERRIAQISTLQNFISRTISLHLQVAPSDVMSGQLALDAVLRYKGKAQESMAQTNVALRRSLPAEHQHLLHDLSRVRGRFAALSNRLANTRRGEILEQLRELKKEEDHIWRELTRRSRVVNEALHHVDARELQAAVPQGAAVVEIARYQSYQWTTPEHTNEGGEARYAAYILHRGGFDWVELGSADALDEMAMSFRVSLASKHHDVRDRAKLLHDHLMDKIIERLPPETHTLFVAPDSVLNLIPIGAIYDGGHYLVEQYDVRYLSVGRELLRPWSVDPVADTPKIVAVVNPSGSGLEGTKKEAALLEGLFDNVLVLEGDEASEDVVRSHERPGILHMGVHGFVRPGRTGDLNALSESLAPVGESFDWFAKNPMLFSGVQLAVDESVGSGVENAESNDGLLTSYEVSSWDLRGTQLVTISACDGGLGDVRAGEGVLGLRRGFGLAGAQAQLVSLWKISDEVTPLLMEGFYRRVSEGMGRGEAMQEAQLEFLQQGEYAHPYYWGAFVLFGEWAPIGGLMPSPDPMPRLESNHRGCCRSNVGEDIPRSMSTLLLFGLLGLASRRRRRRDTASRLG